MLPTPQRLVHGGMNLGPQQRRPDQVMEAQVCSGIYSAAGAEGS
jgi:hypothetical protein